jgi:predicted nucleic acid-binding protein
VSREFVVDASVVVEFLAPGRFGAAADRFMGGLAWRTPLDLVAPDLLPAECANAFRSLAMREATTDAAAGAAIERLTQLAIELVSSAALLQSAWTYRRHMTVYDGCYAALAADLQRPLVTTDAKLHRACTAAGVASFVVDDPKLIRMLEGWASKDA